MRAWSKNKTLKEGQNIRLRNFKKEPLPEKINILTLILNLVNDDCVQKFLVSDLDDSGLLVVLLPKWIRGGLEDNTGLDEIVEGKAVAPRGVVTVDYRLGERVRYSIAHLVESCRQVESMKGSNNKVLVDG